MTFLKLCLFLEEPFVDPTIDVADPTREQENHAIEVAKDTFIFNYNNKPYMVYLERVTPYLYRFVLTYQNDFAGRIDIDCRGPLVEGKRRSQIVHAENVKIHKGLIRSFLQNVIMNKWTFLCSDYQQSPMGRKMWEKIYEQNPYNIWFYDLSEQWGTMQKVLTKKQLMKLYDQNSDDIIFIWKK